MMATAKQIAANQKNAGHSTGPRTEEGKAISRANAIKHGMAAERLVGEVLQEAYIERKAEWDQHFKPATPNAQFALDAAVQCSFRIEECAANLQAIACEHASRARRTWQTDRMAEVATLAGRLASRPEVVAPQLQTTKQGVELMLGIWNRLAFSLDAKNGEWSEAEISTAFDLLGIARHLRDGLAPFDAGSTGDLHATRREFVLAQMDRLEGLLSSGLNRIDAEACHYATTAAAALRTKPAALVLRYEREAWKRYDEMLTAAQVSTVGEPEAQEEPEVEEEPEEDPAEKEAARKAALQAGLEAEIRAQPREKTLQMLAEIEEEMKRRGIEIPQDEPELPPSAPSRSLSRQPRRRLAAAARRAKRKRRKAG